jgi:nicotinate-nucleotide adenylyltransferase
VKVAVFGGSFNPPHVSHVLACVLLLSADDVDQVLVVPAFRHPFSKALAPFPDRLAMCNLAMGWIPGVTVSPLEAEIGGESRTLHTLKHLGAAHPDWSMRLAIGADILGEAPRWLGFEEIAQLAPPIVLGRAGVRGTSPTTGVELPEVSSTRIRSALQRGNARELAGLLPRTVLEYIRERDLYREPDSRAG